MKSLRRPSQNEQILIEFLINKATDLRLAPTWRDALLVQAMDDGAMGSLLLFPKGASGKVRLLGRVASQCEFDDADGVKVLVSLNLDKEGDLFEIDSWKVDFSSLIRIAKDFS